MAKAYVRKVTGLDLTKEIQQVRKLICYLNGEVEGPFIVL